MTRQTFEKVEVGDYVQVTQHGQNKGKIGQIVKLSARGAYLTPYNCEFKLLNIPDWRQKDGLTVFNYESLKYLDKTPIVPEKVELRFYNFAVNELDFGVYNVNVAATSLEQAEKITYSRLCCMLNTDDFEIKFKKTLEIKKGLFLINHIF
jgi:hypothetical protein